jgi:hypothetical protein
MRLGQTRILTLILREIQVSQVTMDGGVLILSILISIISGTW